MQETTYDALLEYAGEPHLRAELDIARQEFIERTGPLFDSDPSFERRLTSFLEWFLFDRPMGPSSTKSQNGIRPIDLYLKEKRLEDPTTQCEAVEQFAESTMELMEFRRWKDGRARFRDLISKARWVVEMPGVPLGLAAGDIVLGRLIRSRKSMYLCETMTLFPKGARRIIIKSTKGLHKKPPSSEEQEALIHRLAYLANRGERYGHVDSKDIFKVLLASLKC